MDDDHDDGDGNGDGDDAGRRRTMENTCNIHQT